MDRIRITVTNAADSGPGSLRAALESAGPRQGRLFEIEIVFAPALKGATIRLDSPLAIGGGEPPVFVLGDIDRDGRGDIVISGDSDGNGVAGPGDSALLAVGERERSIVFADFRFVGGYAEAGPGGTAALIESDGFLALERSEIVGGLVRGGGLAATFVTRGRLELRDVAFLAQVAEGGADGGAAVAGVAAVPSDDPDRVGSVLLGGVVFDGRATGGDAAAGPGGSATVGLSGPAAILSVGGGPAPGFAVSVGSEAAGGAGTSPGVATLGHAAVEPQAPLAPGVAGGPAGDIVDRTSETAAGFVLGLGGNDRIVGGAGADRLEGGAGNDTIFAGLGAGGAALGGDGDDLVFVRAPGVFATGGRGGQDFLVRPPFRADATRGDTVSFELWQGTEGLSIGLEPDFISGFDRAIGSPLDDLLTFARFVDGRGGDDELIVYEAGARALGGDGDDTLNAMEDRATLEGGAGDDRLVLFSSTVGSAALDGGAGTDTAFLGVGFARSDLSLRDGALVVSGIDPARGAFSFTLRGVERLDAFGREFDIAALFPPRGGAAADRIDGSPLEDAISGGGGADTLTGFEAADVLRGGGGRDLIDGGDGADRLFGDGGGDRLIGGGDRDRLFGGAGADTLESFGASRLSGGAGADVLIGLTEDTLVGGAGDDRLIFRESRTSGTGGAGRDVFAFSEIEFDQGDGLIRDFRHGQDRIELTFIPFERVLLEESERPSGISQVGVSYGGIAISVFGSEIDDFDLDDFIFV